MPLFLVRILARLAKVPTWAWKALACICIVITLFLAHQHYARRAIAEAKAEQKAADDKLRAADRAAYVRAQAEAKTANDAHNRQVEQHYQRISDDERQSYLSDRAKLIAYYNGLRAHRQAAPGAANHPGSPAPSAAPGGTDGDGLQVPPADDLQTQQDAAEIELRLLHLQQYVIGVLGVDPNK